MKRFFTLLLMVALFAPYLVHAQTAGVAYRLRGGLFAARPTVCRATAPVDQYYATDTDVMYVCDVANHWKILAAASTAGPGTVTTTGTMTTDALVTSNGGTVIKTPSATATLDSNGKLTVQSVTVNGAGPSQFDFTESTAPSGAANHSLLYSYATSHRLMMNLNNGGAVNVVASGADINTSDQVTVTHLAAPLPVNQGGTGLTSFTAHNLLTGGSAGTALGSVAPGTNGNVLTSNGTDWTSAAAAGGSVNPTSTFMPYNNAGIFADSPLAVSGGNSTTSGNLTSAKSKGFLTTVVDATGSGSLANPIYGASGGPVAYIGDVFGASDGWVFSTSDSVNEIGFGSGFLGLKSTHVLAWATSTNVSANVAPDIGLSRISAGVLGLGNGSQADFSATLKTTTINAVTNYQVNGVTIYSGGTPSIAGNATLNTGSKDSAGKVTATGTGASTIVLTFSITFTRAPACFVTNETTSNLVRPLSTTTTLTFNATIVTGDSLSYQCTGY